MEILFFYGYDNTAGGSLWKSDGTTAGTVMVKDTDTSSTGWGPAKLTEVGSALYFVGFDTSSGYALWRSDGTTGGTYKVRDIDSSSLYNAPQDLVAFGNMVFFSGYDSNNGWALWKSDGTYFGTVMVKDTYSPSPQSTEPRPEYLTVVGNSLFYSSYDTTAGESLWVSDGTTGGTTMLKDFDTSSDINGPEQLTAFGNLLAFEGWSSIMIHYGLQQRVAIFTN